MENLVCMSQEFFYQFNREKKKKNREELFYYFIANEIKLGSMETDLEVKTYR